MDNAFNASLGGNDKVGMDRENVEVADKRNDVDWENVQTIPNCVRPDANFAQLTMMCVCFDSLVGQTTSQY
jgi:hypothetical protein